MRFLPILAVVSALAVAAMPAAAKQLVVNGGFETTTAGPGEFDSHTVATGWSSNGYNFIFAAGTGDTIGTAGGLSLWGTHNGGNDVFTDSPTGGNFVAADGAFQVAPIQQTITGLKAGKAFTVSFDWAAAQQTGFTGDTTEQWQVSLGSQTLSTAVYANPSHSFSGWMHESFTFTATGTSEVLSFLAVGTPDGKPPFSLLDGVTGTAAVPEAATWAMMIGGLGLVGGVLRFRRRGTVAA
ncbi:MAG: PEPxxWA-CTERM sorting domain-containing protein [Janthinobacterium lividum]